MLLASGIVSPLCRHNVLHYLLSGAKPLLQKATAVPLDLANVIKSLDGNPHLETNGAISGANPILIEISRPTSIPFLFQVAGMLKPKKCEGIDHRV
jgi:hypothetical protein